MTAWFEMIVVVFVFPGPTIRGVFPSCAWEKQVRERGRTVFVEGPTDGEVAGEVKVGGGEVVDAVSEAVGLVGLHC